MQGGVSDPAFSIFTHRRSPQPLGLMSVARSRAPQRASAPPSVVS